MRTSYITRGLDAYRPQPGQLVQITTRTRKHLWAAGAGIALACILLIVETIR